jgi:hypothetical protein
MKGLDANAQHAWQRLERHFHYHGLLIDRFRSAGPALVLDMIRTRRNEHGNSLSAFEHEALVERYCELFGRWPPA